MAVGSRQAVRSALHSSKRVRYLMNLKQKKKKSQPSTQTQPHKHKHWNHQTNEWWDNILYNHQKTGDIHLTVRFTDLAHLRLLREEWQKTRPHLHLATPTLLLSRWATVWVYFLCSEKAVKKLKIHTHTLSQLRMSSSYLFPHTTSKRLHKHASPAHDQMQSDLCRESW